VIDVDQLAAIAAELAVRVRDETPDANAAWLAAELPDPADWFRLAFVLAAAIPDDRSWTALTAWAWATKPDPDIVDEGEVLRPAKSARPGAGKPLEPCGTPAAAARHRYHGEDLCTACRLHEQIRDRVRKAESRARTAA
jgi:hypothetical protein